MRKISLILLVCIFALLISTLPAYAATDPNGFEIVHKGNSQTGDPNIYEDRDSQCQYQTKSAQVFCQNEEAGMDAGSFEGGSTDSNGNIRTGESSTATVSGSVPSSYTSTREKVGESQTITRSDGTSGTRDTYSIDGEKTQIVNTYTDGSETSTTFNSDGTKITTTDGQSWTGWFRTDGDSSESASGSTKGDIKGDSGSPSKSGGLSDEPIGKGKPESATELYEFTHDNITGELTAIGTTKDKGGRELDIKIVIAGEDSIPDTKPEPADGSAGKDKDETSLKGDKSSGGKTDGTDGKEVKTGFTKPGSTTEVRSGREGESPYKDLQTFTEDITKIQGGRTVTVDTPGKVTVTQDFEDGTTKTFTVTGDGSIEYDYTITEEDGTSKTYHTRSSFSHDTEERTEFVGYDWTIENLTDPLSPFYMSPTSFTAPGMTERQYEDGPIDRGGLLPVGEGYIKKDGRDYWFINYGDHTATVTPWWNVDVYECWEETSESTDEFGNTSTDTEYFEEYRYSYKSSRPPRIFEFTIPLVCLDCPVPAEGYRACVGGSCDCVGYSDELMTVCDDEHTVELDIENRVELEQ